MSIENKVKLLWDCARNLVGDGHAHKLLKSHYINTCRNLARNSIQIPKEKFAISQMCPHCGCFWSESEFSLKLKTQRVSNNAKTSQLIENFDKSKDPANRKLLSKKQRNRAKWLKKRVTNYMEINCRQCKHKSLVKMEKPKIKPQNTVDKKINLLKCGDINVAKNTAKPKNIKKIKSKTAGLKIPEIINTKEQNKETKLTTASATKHTEKLPPKPNNSHVNEKQLHKKQKSKLNSKKKNKSLTTTTPTSNKVISKTQKHNSLLQLAALLKNQSSISDAKSSTQKKLESLLK